MKKKKKKGLNLQSGKRKAKFDIYKTENSGL